MDSESIHSIIPPQAMPRWTMLEQTDPLVELHRRFWFNREYWDIFNLGDEGADRNDEDGSAEQDDGLGIRPGHVLNLMAFGRRRSVLVRREYIRMYKRCADYLGNNINEAVPPSVVITGQPGIGKRYWIFYAICRRLTQRKPTMWYCGGTLFLFVKEGVYEMVQPLPCTQFLSRVWTLTDTDEGSVVPPSLAGYDTQCLVIFTSSLDQKRWKGLAKNTICVEVIMNPWSRREISEAAPIYGFRANDERIDDMYSRVGPTPRICFNYLEEKSLLDQHESRFEKALSELSSTRLLEIVYQAHDFDMDQMSHTMFLVRRRGDLSRRLSTVEPITAVVAKKIRNQLGRDTRAERLILYRSLVNVEGSRRLASIPYELLAQEMLQQHDYDLIPMEYTPGQGRTLPRWNSLHGSSTHPSSVTVPFSIRGTARDSYTSMPSIIKDDVYYAPEASDQVAVDSFIKIGEVLFILQFTIASKHDIKKGIFDLFPQDSQPSKLKWHFVFVVPPELSELSCPLQSDMTAAFLEPVSFYSMVVDPEPGA